MTPPQASIYLAWHAPHAHLLAHSLILGVTCATLVGSSITVIMYLFTACVAATLEFAREHPTTLVPVTAKWCQLYRVVNCEHPMLSLITLLFKVSQLIIW